MQAAEEVAAEIERQIRDASQKVDAFIASQSLELSKVLHDHELSMRDLEGKIQRLKTDYSQVSERGQSLQSQLALERAKLAERQGEVARLEASASSLPAEMDTIRAKEEAAQRQHAAARQGAFACLKAPFSSFSTGCPVAHPSINHTHTHAHTTRAHAAPPCPLSRA